MKTLYLKVLAGLVLLMLIAVPIGCKIAGLNGMFRPHTYNWRTGMPSLRDQVTAFQQANRRWPRDYGDLVDFMNQTITNFVPESYDRIEFKTKSDGNLEISVYVLESGLTNNIVLTPSNKH